jgi:hypothetical protein
MANSGEDAVSAKTKRRRRIPHKVLRIATYERLKQYLRALADRHFHLLILFSVGDLAKSRSVKAILGDRVCWIEGNASPFGIYVKLYRHRDEQNHERVGCYSSLRWTSQLG